MKTYTHPNVPDNPIQDEDSLPEYTGQDLSDPDADYDNFREYHGSLVEDCASLVEQCEAFIALRNTPAMPNIFELARLEREAEQKRLLEAAIKQVERDADNLNWGRAWKKLTT